MRNFWRMAGCFIATGVLGLFSTTARADAPAWMHTAANAPLPTYDVKTSAVLIYSEDVTTVMPDGKTKAIVRRAYKILRPEGREYAVAEAYIAHDTRIGSMKAWCVPQQGKDYEVKDKDAVDRSIGLTEDVISDVKLRTLKIPAGDVGNVVGYEIQYDGRPYVLDDEWEFQREIPVKEARYTLQMPPGWEYKAIWLNHAKVEPTPSGTNQWQWVVADIPEIRHERRMPPWPGVAGRMVVAFLAPGARPQNGFLTWDDMARWQTGLANGKRDATPEINSKVAEITAGKPMPQQQLQQIAQYIQKDIRYVAIEIGIGGWQPHSATEIFSHRYGDCKDKATLMSTMLKLAGIDSYYLFINTRRGAVGPETPPERMFDHAILAIKLPAEIKDPRYQAIFNHPKLGNLLIFDPTNEKTPIGQLSGELQGNYALLVSPEGGELIRTPQLPTMSNGITRTGNFSLDAQGTLKAEIAESRKGDLASWERHEQSSVSNSKDRVKRIEQEVSHSIGMFEMTSASMTGLDANEVPFGYSYTFVAPGYAKQAGELLVVRPRVMGIETSDLLETKEARKFPVIFEGPRKDTDAFEITLPGGYEVDDLPPPTDIDYSFASYHSKTDAAGNKLKYTRTLEIKELSVPMEKMDELKKFYRVIASDERNTAVLKPSTAAASAK
jgi:hypothetical protein